MTVSVGIVFRMWRRVVSKLRHIQEDRVQVSITRFSPHSFQTSNQLNF